jgi:hypothetical protein
MKVSELIELLEEQDPDAEVLVMMQQNWPYAERRFMRSVLRRSVFSGDIPEGR